MDLPDLPKLRDLASKFPVEFRRGFLARNMLPKSATIACETWIKMERPQTQRRK